MKLGTKISLALVGVLVLAVLSSVVALLSAHRIGSLMQSMVTDNVGSVRAAEELEVALLEQRGFVSSYILDGGNDAWLEELARRKPGFVRWLARARDAAHTDAEREILGRLTGVYHQYNAKREQVITLYRNGNILEAKAILLGDVNSLYDQAYTLCEDLIAANERYIESSIARGRRETRRASLMVGLSVVFTSGLGVGLLLLFFRGVVRPLRRMAEDASLIATERPPNVVPATSPQDELRAVGFYLQTLMSDVAETRSHLEHSRAQLLNAEKLASVGKLAASVAHEIRNPLTSLKMRLFSIRRAVGDTPQCNDDFQVVSEEITRLENVIRNFLEFSRPPELKPRAYSISVLIDKTLELVGHWLREKNIRLVRGSEAGLPPVMADSDQIKQVFINLLRNSVEAISEGGEVEILTTLEQDKAKRPMIAVRFRDNGPGIAGEIRDRIFEPFFSTKAEGTGLGLCIAAQIMARHGGRLELEASTDQGTTFVVWIPVAGSQDDGQDTCG